MHDSPEEQRCNQVDGQELHPEQGHLGLKMARLREGKSLRSVARSMRKPMSLVRRQEEGLCELTIADVYRWRDALKIPLSEVLQTPRMALQERIRQRACLVRVLKTAKFMIGELDDEVARELAQTLVDEIQSALPEYEEIAAWPKGRPSNAPGKVAEEISTSEWLLPDLD